MTINILDYIYKNECSDIYFTIGRHVNRILTQTSSIYSKIKGELVHTLNVYVDYITTS